MTNREERTHTLIQAVCKEALTWFKREPDWEQRRYEIAKDLVVHKSYFFKTAVEEADKLVEELKKNRDGADSKV